MLQDKTLITHNWTSGVIRMGSQYESEKVEIILAQVGLNGLHLIQFECPRHLKPPVSSNFEVGRFPFSHCWTSGVKKIVSQYESEKVGIIFPKEELNGLHLVQFECPRHWKPPVSSNFEVGRFPFSHNWTSGAIRIGPPV